MHPWVRLDASIIWCDSDLPSAILEDAGIAWPNAVMWQAAQQTYMPSSPGTTGPIDPDAHAHSPRRRHASRELNIRTPTAVAPPRLLAHTIMPPPSRQHAMMNESNWATASHMQDVFGGQGHPSARSQSTRMSISDDSMPDYSHSITPRSSRDPSIHDVQNVHDRPSHQHESQFEDLMAAFSPAKMSGTQAPPTTRVSSAANSPRATVRTSGAPEIRITSYYGQPRAVSVTTRDAPPQLVRARSDVSMNSRFSEQQAGESENSQPKIKVVPAKEIKGRKEGRSSELDSSTPKIEKIISRRSSGRRQKDAMDKAKDDASASDSKRKRSSLTSITNALSENPDGPGSSPSRKVSRKEGIASTLANSPNSPESVIRAPLGTLRNVQ
ncbi:MAG: hypothetical protein Q9170_002142 [Blastenia crenularia]